MVVLASMLSLSGCLVNKYRRQLFERWDRGHKARDSPPQYSTLPGQSVLRLSYVSTRCRIVTLKYKEPGCIS